jgi:hypothetical protein
MAAANDTVHSPPSYVAMIKSNRGKKSSGARTRRLPSSSSLSFALFTQNNGLKALGLNN